MINKISLLSDIAARLASISDTPDLDASVLLAHILDRPRAWVMAHPELTLTTGQQSQLDDSLSRLENREPLPYVIGRWEFFGLNLEVTRDVLIPRPETELLVEKAIAYLGQNPQRKNVADVGTGSGAIAVSIAVHIPNAEILATDISPRALEVAKRNAEKHNVTRAIQFIECDLLPSRQPQTTDSSSFILHSFGFAQDKPSSFDLICANLPYIPTDTLHSLPTFNREPTLALDGGADGLDLIRRLLHSAPEWLVPNGLILLEIEARRGARALNLAHDLFSHAGIHLHRDLAGHDRLLEIQL
jgi:release factor glutamine methyltransferase